MKSVVLFLLLAIVGPLLVSIQVRAVNPENSGGLGSNATSLCAELIEPNGYTCTEHTAVTGDGFKMGLQNIPFPQGVQRPSYGRPVVLQHGLEAGGDNFVDNGANLSLAFVLADAGFDVWISNFRCIQWSHGHVSLTPNQSAYWNWTYDELASYDLLAATEYVSNARGGIQIAYIGHSLGTSIIFAGLTNGQFRSQILENLNAVVLLAPVVFSRHQVAPLLTEALIQYSTLNQSTTNSSEYSIYNNTQTVCGVPIVNPVACYTALTLSLGLNSYINPSYLAFYIQYFPQPTSTYNLNHLGQGYVENNFAFYDRGEAGNNAAYGQPTAPEYNLTLFPACLPVQYWSGGIDGVADPTDTARLMSLLPKENAQVHNLTNYGHIDFVLGTNAYIDVYPGIIEYLNNHTATIYCDPYAPSPSPSPSPPPPSPPPPISSGFSSPPLPPSR